MPVYNGQRYLDEAVASVLAQDLDDFEFVIVDDGSTDATPELIAKWAARDSRIVQLRMAENGGVPRALNAGLAIARGAYIARQDADDISLPGRLVAQVAALEGNEQAVLAIVGRAWIDEDGKIVRNVPPVVQRPEVVRFLLHYTHTAVGVPGQAMFRTAAARAVGGWDAAFAVAQGWELVTRLARLGTFLTLPQLGMQYRLHPGRASERHAALQAELATLVTRAALSRLLGRELTLQEAAASASVWFLVRPHSGSAPTAFRLLREGLERFDLSKRDRAIVKRIAVSRFARVAARHALRGNLCEAAQHLSAAVRAGA